MYRWFGDLNRPVPRPCLCWSSLFGILHYPQVCRDLDGRCVFVELYVGFFVALWCDHGVNVCNLAIQHFLQRFLDLWFGCVSVDDEGQFVVALHHVNAFFVAERVFDCFCHRSTSVIVVSVNSVRRPGWLPGVRSWKVSSDGVLVVTPGMFRRAL